MVTIKDVKSSREIVKPSGEEVLTFIIDC